MNPYIPLLMLFVFGAVFTGGFLLISQLLSPRRKRKASADKDLSYECGVNTVGSTRERFSVKFYLVAMLFILFDIEVVFLYPWAVLFRELLAQGPFLFFEMLAFLAIMAVGLIYVYGTRAIKWD
jgi:NADH-quinone oxidoreductase subunit A